MSAGPVGVELEDGLTPAIGAPKQVIHDLLEGGVELADERVPEVAGRLFDSEDLKGAVRSFLEHGPGNAKFSGR